MALQGTFDVLDFTEVLRLISSHEMTGRLFVRHRSYGANLFFEGGLLTGADQSEHQPAATIGDVEGRIEEVCFEMLEADRGTFEFHPGKASTLPVDTRYHVADVLDQARRRLDEWHQLQEVIPSLELQPHLVAELGGSEVTLDKLRWRVLTSVDGRRNLRAIGRVVNLSDFDVCRVMRGLIDDGVVALEGLAALSASNRDALPTVVGPESAAGEHIWPAGRGDAAVGDNRSPSSAEQGVITPDDPVETVVVVDATSAPATADRPPVEEETLLHHDHDHRHDHDGHDGRHHDEHADVDAVGPDDGPSEPDRDADGEETDGIRRRSRLVRIRSREQRPGPP